MLQTPLTIQEAADLLSVSDKTVRRMLDDGILQEASRDTRGRILITPESLEAAAARSKRTKGSGQETREAAPAPDVAIAVSTFAEMVRERDQHIYELTNEIADLRAGQRALTMQAEAAQARVQQLEQELAAANKELAELWAALAAPEHPPDQSSNRAEGSLIAQIRRRIGLG